MKAPNDLAAPGRELWGDLQKTYVLDGTEQLLAELCRLHDRLHEVRAILRAEGLMKDGRRHPLVDMEPKLSAQFQKIWKQLGLSDSELPKNPVGRPPIYGRGKVA